MELSINNLWYYDVPSSPLEFTTTEAYKHPNPNPSSLPAPSNDLHEEGSPRLQNLHRAFDTMDADHDGELSGRELCDWMKKLGLKFTEEGMVCMIDRADVRRCGSLDFEEFVSLSRAIEAEEEREELTCTEEERKAAHRAILAEVFELFDKDHNGLISPKELCDTLESLGLLKKGDDTQYVEMIERMDSDGDGQVSFSDFQNMMDQKAMMDI